MRPLTYFNGQTILGHYANAQRSGDLAATIGALGHLASIRWPTGLTSYLVLMRIRVGITISGAVTTAVETNFRAIKVNNFTTDFTTATTLLAGQRVRTSMATSKTGTRIATTAVMSGQTLTAEAGPFAMATFTNPSTTLGTIAVTNQVGAGVPMQTLYEWTGLGQHPVMLFADEGIVIQPVTAGPASGTWALYTQWEWAEVLAF